MFLHKTLIFSTLLYTLFSCSVDNSSEQKKVFRYNEVGALSALDPALTSDMSAVWINTQLYNGLVELDDNMKVKPALASHWDISENGKCYTFYMRKGTKFHDHKLFTNGKGRSVTAYDVEFSLKRICDTNDIYNKGIWIFRDKVLKNPNGTLSDTCFKAVNNEVFKVYLQKPNPLILQVLSMAYAFVVAPEIVKHYGADYRRNPVGTGPFKLFMWEEGNSLVLHKNENYWRKDKKGNQLPYLDAVQLYFITERAQAFRAFSTGKIDMLDGLDEYQIEDVLKPNGETKEGLNYVVSRNPYLYLEYIGIQLNKEANCYKKHNGKHPLFDKNFRKALCYGVDKGKLINILRNGLGEPARSGIVPLATPGFAEGITQGYAYSPKKAKEYLAKSGWTLETLPVLVMSAGKVQKNLMEFIVKSWEESLGIKVEIRMNEPKVNYDLAIKGELEMFRAAWVGDYPDAENYLTLFYGPNESPFGPNKTHYSNPKVDSLFALARTITNDSARLALYYQMDQLIVDDAPVIPLYYNESLTLVNPKVKNLKFNAMKLLKLEEVDITQ